VPILLGCPHPLSFVPPLLLKKKEVEKDFSLVKDLDVGFSPIGFIEKE